MRKVLNFVRCSHCQSQTRCTDLSNEIEKFKHNKLWPSFVKPNNIYNLDSRSADLQTIRLAKTSIFKNIINHHYLCQQIINILTIICLQSRLIWKWPVSCTLACPCCERWCCESETSAGVMAEASCWVCQWFVSESVADVAALWTYCSSLHCTAVISTIVTDCISREGNAIGCVHLSPVSTLLSKSSELWH